MRISHQLSGQRPAAVHNLQAAMQPVDPAKRRDVPIALGVGIGCLSAIANWALLFRAWFVAAQSEADAVTIIFTFLAIVPWIGIAGAGLRKRWGAWVLISCPLVACAGLPFIRIEDVRFLLVFIPVCFLPLMLAGILLWQRLRGIPQQQDRA